MTVSPEPTTRDAAATDLDELTAHLAADHRLPLGQVEAWGAFGRAYCHRLEHEVLKQEHPSSSREKVPDA